MRIRRVLKRQHRIDVSLMGLFQHPTVRSLATYLAAGQQDAE
jgi:hypothetical protein